MSSYWHLSMSEGIALNQKKICKLDGCERNRIRLSSW